MKIKTMFITGDTGEGKTCVAYHFIKKIGKPCHVFKHPKPELIKKIGYVPMRDIDEVEDLNNATLWLDEPQITLPKYEKRGSIVLNKLLSLCRQKDITVIISTSDTRYITAAEEFYVDTYIIKKIDYSMIKRGSKIKKIIKELATLTPEGYADNIKKNEYVFYSRKHKEDNGKHTFKKPDFFDESYSKPFS